MVPPTAESVAAAVVLSRSTLMTVRRVLHAYREGWLLEGRLAAAARRVAEDARRHGATAARMLVALKQAWASLEEVRGASPLDMRALLDRVVTHSIKAYYAAPRPGRGAVRERRSIGRAPERASA